MQRDPLSRESVLRETLLSWMSRWRNMLRSAQTASAGRKDPRSNSADLPQVPLVRLNHRQHTILDAEE